jgi:hypothetical protein
MTKLTIDDKEYDTESFSEDQTKILNLINLGQNAETLINHIHQCVKVVQQMKIGELKETLKETDDDK